MDLLKMKMLAGLAKELALARVLKWRRPIFVSLFPTNRCNLRCHYCFVYDESVSKEIRNAEFSRDELFEIVDEFYRMGMRWIFLLGGEPLVHKDIGEIVDYIVSKGILLHVITNGILIEKKIDQIKNAHALCVSLDGDREANDSMRGKGSFDRAIAGIKLSRKHRIPVRIHATLGRHNLHSFKSIVEVAGELGVVVTFSPPNHLCDTTVDDMKITDDEYREFWSRYNDLKKNGYPIGNSAYAIRKCLTWPKDYHQYITREEVKHLNYKPVPCVNGELYCALGADGTLYNCINLGCTNGPNIVEHGIRGAWERLLEWRPNCISCSSLNTIETAVHMRLVPTALLKGALFHLTRGGM